jgi:uncharacterized protein YjbI with pentapeptide repeats
MANEEHLTILKQGVELWNKWRLENAITPDLGGAELDSFADLGGANLSGAYLTGAGVRYANLSDADLSDADLRDANLGGAILRGADLSGAILSGAILSGANLTSADLTDADLSRTVWWKPTSPTPRLRAVVLTELLPRT